MKKLSKKTRVILTASLCAVFFVGIMGVMVGTGRIDLSKVPVLGSMIAMLQNTAETDTTVPETPEDAYTSVTDVVVSGEVIYAADRTGKKAYKLDKNGEVLAVYEASSQVNAIVENGDVIYVLEGALQGQVTLLDRAMKKTSSIRVGHTPSAMVITGTKAYVANRFDNAVAVLDLEKGEVVSTIAIDGREAIDMALAGDKLYVACHLPEEGASSDVISANVLVINTKTDEVMKNISLVNGAGGVKGICASPDGERVYVSHIIARYAYPTTQLDRGWINTNGFSAIDTATDTATAMLLDEVEEGASNPWGVAVSENGKYLVVALSGTDEAMVVDISKMNAKIRAVENGDGVVKSVDAIADYLPFLDDCRTRVDLSGKGARAVTVDKNTAYIGQYFTGDIATINLNTNGTGTISFVEQPRNDDRRAGEILFADANLCYQKWESCLSCHPDALADGLNWDNLNDGLGNPKSAKSLLYSHRTPPVMSTGIRANAEIAVRAGMKFIQFNVLEEEQMAKIDVYLKALQPVQSPYLNRDGTLTESAQRGKTLFEEKGCATCHPAPLYTDLKTHHSTLTDTATNWEKRDMDSPTLVEVWRTGPWGYDGRFATMEEAVAYYTKDLGLTEEEITDLSNFVMSIGDEGELYGVEQVFVKAGSEAISKLVPGGSVNKITVRRQKKDAKDTATVKVTLTDAKGETVKTETVTLEGVAFNTAKEITLTGFEIPEEAGSTLTVTVKDADGKEVATPYMLKN